jgi:hypothetical protein
MKKMLIVTTAGAVFAPLSPAFADQDPYARAYNTDNILLNRGGPYRTDTTTDAVECFVVTHRPPRPPRSARGTRATDRAFFHARK